MSRSLSKHSLLLAALACALLSTTEAQTAGGGVVALENGVDASVRPGDDFFAFANGAWLEATGIPAGRQRWSARDDIAELTKKRVAALLVDAAAAPPGSSARKVADFHAAWLDEGAIEARGTAALTPILARIDRLRDKASLSRLLGRELRADVDPLDKGVFDSDHVLGLAVQPSTHGETGNVAFLLQGGLGLPSRDDYLGSTPRQQALRSAYRTHVARMLTLVGIGASSARVEAVMTLETALARSHASVGASGEDRNADHVWTRADFARRAPGMDWPAFFDAAGLGAEKEIVAWQPGAVTGLAALVASVPLPAWQDYLRLHAVHRHADVLPRAFAESAAMLRAEIAGESAEASSRTQRALDATQASLSATIGRLYVERHFGREQKARARRIVADVVAAFGQRIERVAWMSPSAKTMARAKLNALYGGMGYPERWPDDADFVVDRADAFANLRRAWARDRRHALARLGRRADRTEWAIAPQSGGAVLLFHRNALDFSAALLVPPKFDPDASDAAAYGAIGAVVGHEVSHFVDTLGADYEVDGRMRRWWSAEDLAGFRAATAPLASQFDAYRAVADRAVDGTLTLGENVADLGGLAAAFDAYRRTLGPRAGDADRVRRQDREFFIAFARAWRSKSTDDGLRAQIATDSHAPDRYRVATVRNLDAWYVAFDVRPGQRLYLEPGARLSIW